MLLYCLQNATLLHNCIALARLAGGMSALVLSCLCSSIFVIMSDCCNMSGI